MMSIFLLYSILLLLGNIHITSQAVLIAAIKNSVLSFSIKMASEIAFCDTGKKHVRVLDRNIFFSMDLGLRI